MRDAESILYEAANGAQQFFQIQDRSGLLCDGVDRLQLPGALLLKRVEAGILQGDGGLRGKKSKKIDGFGVETVLVLALAIEHADDLIADHERDGQLRVSGLRGTDVAG